MQNIKKKNNRRTSQFCACCVCNTIYFWGCVVLVIQGDADETKEVNITQVVRYFEQHLHTGDVCKSLIKE